MPKLDLRNALRIKVQGGELLRLKGDGFAWEKPASDADLGDWADIVAVTGAASDAAVGESRVIDFSASGSFTTGSKGGDVRVLGIGGGTSGNLHHGRQDSGGPGAPGLPRDENGDVPILTLAPNTEYTVEIGAGGAEITTTQPSGSLEFGNAGTATRILAGATEVFIAPAAPVAAGSNSNGVDGPSGSGAARWNGFSDRWLGGNGTPGLGHDGGDDLAPNNFAGPASGGGAGGRGVDREGSNGFLAGGPGYVSSITGVSQEYGRGGPVTSRDGLDDPAPLDGRDGYGDSGGNNGRFELNDNRRSGKGGHGRLILQVGDP